MHSSTRRCSNEKSPAPGRPTNAIRPEGKQLRRFRRNGTSSNRSPHAPGSKTRMLLTGRRSLSARNGNNIGRGRKNAFNSRTKSMCRPTSGFRKICASRSQSSVFLSRVKPIDHSKWLRSAQTPDSSSTIGSESVPFSQKETQQSIWELTRYPKYPCFHLRIRKGTAPRR